MTITRRNFLIGSGAAAVTGFTLHKVPAVLEMIPEWGGERYGLLVDYTTKTISIAPDHPGMTVYQLQRTIVQWYRSKMEKRPFTGLSSAWEPGLSTMSTVMELGKTVERIIDQMKEEQECE
jgi:hypothetical protein